MQSPEPSAEPRGCARLHANTTAPTSPSQGWLWCTPPLGSKHSASSSLTALHCCPLSLSSFQHHSLLPSTNSLSSLPCIHQCLLQKGRGFPSQSSMHQALHALIHMG